MAFLAIQRQMCSPVSFSEGVRRRVTYAGMLAIPNEKAPLNLKVGDIIQVGDPYLEAMESKKNCFENYT